MLAYVRYDKAKFQYDLTNQYFRAAVTPGRTVEADFEVGRSALGHLEGHF